LSYQLKSQLHLHHLNTAFTGSRPSLSGNTPIGKLTYTLAGADATDFSIDSSTGIIFMVARNFEVPADANTDNVYEVTIIATDVDNRASKGCVFSNSSISNGIDGEGGSLSNICYSNCLSFTQIVKLRQLL
jgi:hypothetical protein